MDTSAFGYLCLFASILLGVLTCAYVLVDRLLEERRVRRIRPRIIDAPLPIPTRVQRERAQAVYNRDRANGNIIDIDPYGRTIAVCLDGDTMPDLWEDPTKEY